MERGKAFAWGIAVVACTAIPAILLLNTGVGEYSQGWVANVAGPVAIFTSVAVGLVVALRRPSNPIGWLLLANGLIFGWFGGFPGVYAGYALEHPGTLPGGRLAAVWDTAAWPLLFAGVVAIAFVFPDGRLPSRRWRSIAIGGAVAAAVTMAGGLLSGNALDPPFEDIAPLKLLPDSITGAMQGLGLLGMFAALIAAAVAVVSRFRGSEGELRAQMKWVAYAATLIPVTILVGTLDSGAGLATLLSIMALEILIPLSIGIAVMRYRLYEIDRLVNATLVYGALTVLLAAAFVAVTLFGGVVIGGGSAVPTAAATLAVTLAFRPLRARMQTLVDRRFNRARYEGLQQVDRFLGDLRVGRAQPEGIGDGTRRGSVGSDAAAVFLAAARRGSCRCSGPPRSRVAPDPRRAHPGAARRAPARDRRARPGAARSREPARPGDPPGGARDRDRQASGRSPPSALRGRAVPHAHRHRDLRGTAPARARSPRWGTTAPRLAGPGPAPRPARAGRGHRGRRESDAGFGRRRASRGDRGVARAGARCPARGTRRRLGRRPRRARGQSADQH